MQLFVAALSLGGGLGLYLNADRGPASITVDASESESTTTRAEYTPERLAFVEPTLPATTSTQPNGPGVSETTRSQVSAAGLTPEGTRPTSQPSGVPSNHTGTSPAQGGDADAHDDDSSSASAAPEASEHPTTTVAASATTGMKPESSTTTAAAPPVASTTTTRPPTPTAPTTTRSTTTTSAPTTTTAPPVANPPIALFTSCTEPAPPNSLHVAVGGSDAAAGTVEAPMATITAAVRRALPGQHVLVRGGTYRQEVEVQNKHGEPARYITIRSYPGETAVIESAIGAYGAVFRGSTSYVRLACLDFAGPTLRPEAIPPSDHYTRDLVLAGATFEQNRLNFGVGISIGDTSSAQRDSHHHLDIIGNRIHDYAAGGISTIGANHLRIAHNDIYRNAKYSCYSGSGVSILWGKNAGGGNNADGYSNYVVANRLWRNENISVQCFTSSQGAVRTDGNGIILDNNDYFSDYTARTLIANNVAYANGGGGIVLFLSSRADLVHNTLYQNAQTPDLGGRTGAHPEVVTLMSQDIRMVNNVVLPRQGMTALDNTSWPQAGNQLLAAGSSGGLFTRPTLDGSADFRPAAGSQLIDAGSPFPTIATDYSGGLRTGAPDVGAIEAR